MRNSRSLPGVNFSAPMTMRISSCRTGAALEVPAHSNAAARLNQKGDGLCSFMIPIIAQAGRHRREAPAYGKRIMSAPAPRSWEDLRWGRGVSPQPPEDRGGEFVHLLDAYQQTDAGENQGGGGNRRQQDAGLDPKRFGPPVGKQPVR